MRARNNYYTDSSAAEILFSCSPSRIYAYSLSSRCAQLCEICFFPVDVDSIGDCELCKAICKTKKASKSVVLMEKRWQCKTITYMKNNTWN